MFTDEEEPLLTGDDDDIEAFVDCERCMIIDWRGTEEEAMDDVIRFLPDGALTYEATWPSEETIAIRLRFHDREDSFELPALPQNNFRVLLRVRRLIQPEYDIELFRCTADSDTNGFLLRPSAWWTAYRATYPNQHRKVFRDVSDLNALWELGEPPDVRGSNPG